jgi:hypothetical protein
MDWTFALRDGAGTQRDALIFTSPTRGEHVMSFEQVEPKGPYLAAARIYLEGQKTHLSLLLDHERMSVHATDETRRHGDPNRHQHLFAMAIPNLARAEHFAPLEQRIGELVRGALCVVRHPKRLHEGGARWLLWLGMTGHPITNVLPGTSVVLLRPGPLALREAWEAAPGTRFLAMADDGPRPLGYLVVTDRREIVLLPWAAASRMLEMLLEAVRPERGRPITLSEALPQEWL